MELALLAGSIAGVLLLFGVNVALRGWRRPSFASLADAVEAFTRDHWEATVQDGILSVDARSALLALRTGDAGVVTLLGDKAVTRRFGRSAVRDVALRAGNRFHILEMRLSGDTGNPVRLHLEDAESARRWRDWIAYGGTQPSATPPRDDHQKGPADGPEPAARSG